MQGSVQGTPDVPQLSRFRLSARPRAEVLASNWSNIYYDFFISKSMVLITNIVLPSSNSFGKMVNHSFCPFLWSTHNILWL